MLFMTILTHEPGVRDQVLKRLSEEGPIPKGVKIINRWSSAPGGLAFNLIESDDAMSLRMLSYAWNDLCKIEAYPVTDLEDLKKMLQKK